MLRVIPNLGRLGLSAVLAVCLAAALATSAFAGSQVPFKGSFNETFIVLSGPPVIVAKASGVGNVTHLGHSSESFLGTVFVTGDCNNDTAVGSITGANGDQVFISAAGVFCFSTGVDSGTFTITGGTGRFLGATGGGKYTSLVDFSKLTSSESYDGTIASSGSL
ncbi:MAG TPA: hypothetical protein VKT80_08520 [Chloroflexota bacterium]|nr:hypothetical protein [Chloroflexota bacterium]